MKITFKRLLGMAAIYGIVRYVRAHGGPKAVFDDLSTKARDMMDGAKAKMESAKRNVADTSFATNTGRNGRVSSEGTVGRGSSYASYDLDSDDKLRH
ncbi:MAG: hypothetical protein AB7T06_39375 [Kofleriaceae bacterium]